MAQLHPLALGSPGSFLRAARRYGGVDARYWPRALGILASATMAAPMARQEAREFVAPQLTTAPVFIIGHWRSGTSLLHNLLARDRRFACVTHLQAMAPASYLARRRWLERLGDRAARTVRRPQDDVVVGPLSPQEEEFALANLTADSFVHGWCFPRALEAIFRRCVLLEGMAPAELDGWFQTYDQVLAKAAAAAGAERLLLKNPANTGRVAALRRRFPAALFIHVVREPRAVHASTCRMYDKLLPDFQLQQVEPASIRASVLRIYPAIMQRCLDDLARVPAGQSATVRFEDLERDPLSTVEQLYRALPLGDFDAARTAVSEYSASLTGYRKNQYPRELADEAALRSQWRQVAERIGYPL
jgi:hypothetical protein